jgi:hypothetical protein
VSTVSAAKTILEADETLAAAATGGIWDLDEAGPNGINRTTTPDAFDDNEIIKPCVLLKLRSATPDGALEDEGAQYVSVREVLEVWFYEDDGYSNINTMRDRVYTLLHATQLTGTFKVLWAGDVRNQRDTELDANVERSEFAVHTYKS